jgi:hypothetical protein
MRNWRLSFLPCHMSNIRIKTTIDGLQREDSLHVLQSFTKFWRRWNQRVGTSKKGFSAKWRRRGKMRLAWLHVPWDFQKCNCMSMYLRVEDVGVRLVFWREEEDESKGWVCFTDTSSKREKWEFGSILGLK